MPTSKLRTVLAREREHVRTYNAYTWTFYHNAHAHFDPRPCVLSSGWIRDRADVCCRRSPMGSSHCSLATVKNCVLISLVLLCNCEMESDDLEYEESEYLEDSQRVSASPEPKRLCTQETSCMTPSLFGSPSVSEGSSDGALFPSGHSSVSGSCARYPSEIASQSSQSHSGEDRSIHSEEGGSGTDATPCVNLTGTEQECEQVGSLLVSPCCQKQCLLHLTAHDVLTARERYFSLGGNEQRQWLLDRVHEKSHVEGKGKLLITFSVAGQAICEMSWCHIYNISHRQVTRIVKAVLDGKTVAEHGNKGRRRTNTKSESTKAWMNKYFNLVGDKMPHNSQIHLPSWETQKDVYMRYTEDMTLQSIPATDVMSLSMFYKIWAEDFPSVVIPEVRIDC